MILWIFLLLSVSVFAWIEKKHGECAEYHHRDYQFNALNEKFSRAADKIDQCERWCLRDVECKSFALWWNHPEAADGKTAYCSLCASEEAKPRPNSATGGWYHHSIDETERIAECGKGFVEEHACDCNGMDCPSGSFCDDGECTEPCEHGLVDRTCVCEAQKCERGFFCDAIEQKCVAQCSRADCNNHGRDPDPTDGCNSCECDRHFYGDQCQYTDYQSIKEMKLAFCHPVLFGRTNVTRLETFLDYYRRIGFDQFFFWSEPNVAVEKFLSKQDDVTFRIYNEKYEMETHNFFLYPPGYGGGDKDWYHGQNVAIHSCLKLTQEQGYDWVQFGDSDEFVYFTGNDDIRSFLARFHQFSYISLGKMMYTRQYCAQHKETPNDLFDLLYRPESPFCSFEDNNLYRSYEYCETYFGRRKYIIQPHQISKLQIHEPVLFEGIGMDLSTDVAHVKELKGYNAYEECQHQISDPFIEISDEAEFKQSMHGDFNTYQVQMRHNTTIVTLIKDHDFNKWLHRLYKLPYTPPEPETLYQEFDHVAAFEEFYQKSLENPCSNDAVLFQYWDVCGFGCATNTLVLQILDAYFRGQTFSFSRQHSDYQRYFRFIFEDETFPLCDDEKAVANKPRVEPINPHVFYKTHIHHGQRENALRPLFHHIYHDILWNSLKVWLQDEIDTRFSENPQLTDFTAIHVRRGDKCIEEAHCVSFDKYYEHVAHKEQPIFLMTDALTEVAEEIEECCADVQDQIYTLDENLNKDANTRAWDDGSSFIDLIVEISMAGHAESVVCSGSSNLCRLLWALTNTDTEIFNMDTKSVLCGDARDVACMAPEGSTLYSGSQFKHWLNSLPEHLSKYAADMEMVPSVDTLDDDFLDSIGINDHIARVELKDAFQKEKQLMLIEDHIVVVMDTPGSHIRRNLQNEGSNGLTTTVSPDDIPSLAPSTDQPSIAPSTEQPSLTPTACDFTLISQCTQCRCSGEVRTLSLSLQECADRARELDMLFFHYRGGNRCRIPFNDDQCSEENRETNLNSNWQIYYISCPTAPPTSALPSMMPTICPTSANPTVAPSSGKPSISPLTSNPSISPSTGKPSPAPSASQPSISPSSSLPSAYPTTGVPSGTPTPNQPSAAPTACDFELISQCTNCICSGDVDILSMSLTNCASRARELGLSFFHHRNGARCRIPISDEQCSEDNREETNQNWQIYYISCPTAPPTSALPSAVPTLCPSSDSPTLPPSPAEPSISPLTSIPSIAPSSNIPSTIPTTAIPSVNPTCLPTSDKPTAVPSSDEPSMAPTMLPSSVSPSVSPSESPTSDAPSTLTPTPAQPSLSPTSCEFELISQCTHCICSGDVEIFSMSLTNCASQARELGRSFFYHRNGARCRIPLSDEQCSEDNREETNQNWQIYYISCPTAPPTSALPSMFPAKYPTSGNPTVGPSSDAPSISPSQSKPTISPLTSQPSLPPSSEQPTVSPTILPTTTLPTTSPITSPTKFPTSDIPTVTPTSGPTTDSPTVSPSLFPTSDDPTVSPTNFPSSDQPSTTPSVFPTSNQPSTSPSISPSSVQPSSSPSSVLPSTSPSKTPSKTPITSRPSEYPVTPSITPSYTFPSFSPDTSIPSNCPTSDSPSLSPVTQPPTTDSPSISPSAFPTSNSPSVFPSEFPTFDSPSKSPSSNEPSIAPTTDDPSTAPTSDEPSNAPTPNEPSIVPSSDQPSYIPSGSPTSDAPSLFPTSNMPSGSPSLTPTSGFPSKSPTSDKPSSTPSRSPTSGIPSRFPSSVLPSTSPSTSPTSDTPSTHPTSAPISSVPSRLPTSDSPSSTPSQTPTTDMPSHTPSSAPTSNMPTAAPITCNDNRLCYYNGDSFYDSAIGECSCSCYDGYGGTNCAVKFTISHQYIFENTLEEFNAAKEDMEEVVAQQLLELSGGSEAPVVEFTVNDYEFVSSDGRRFLQIYTTAIMNAGFLSESEFEDDNNAILADTDNYEFATIAAIETDSPTIVVTDIVFFDYCNAIDNCSDRGYTTDEDPSDGCTCVCDDGYGGDDCSEIVSCSVSDCNNSGSTTDADSTDGCDCTCYPGYYGDSCENASQCVRSSNQIGYSSLATSSSSTIDGTDLVLILEVPIDLTVEFIEFHNALDTEYNFPDSSLWSTTEPTDNDDCTREYSWSGSIVDLLGKFDSADIRITDTSLTIDVSVEGTTIVPLTDGSYYERSSATIVPISINLAANAIIDLTVNTLYEGAPITAIVTLYEVTDEYQIRMTISLYSIYPFTISNEVELDEAILPSSYSYGAVAVTEGDSYTCVDGQDCFTDIVIEIAPSNCEISETLLFNFTAIDDVGNSEKSQSEFIVQADFCDTFLGTLDGLSGSIDLYQEDPTTSSPASTSVLYVGGTLYATISLTSAYATVASIALTNVNLSNDENVYSVETSGSELTYSVIDQQADQMTIAVVLDDTYITGSLSGVDSNLFVDAEVTYTTNGRRLLGLDDDSVTLNLEHRFEMVNPVCGKDIRKGDTEVHECHKGGVNIRQCHESGWITIVNNCVNVSE